jgi:hypothetical protein
VTTIDIDGLSEEDFRRSIESRLRQGLGGKAVEKLRALLVPFAGPDKILPDRFLTVTAEELALGGWDALEDNIRRHDLPGRPITALSVAFGWPGEDVPQPDAEGRLSPFIETGYYTDDAFPFSKSAREDLLDGYSFHGCTWTGDCQATDNALWLTGIDDLHGALARLEARLLASDEPDAEGIRAGSLGACLLSALLFQVVDARIAQGGLTRPLCVMAGSNGVYPYFDAPVAGFPEEARKAAEAAEDEPVVDAGVPAPRYSSLLVTGIPRARKRAVLVLAETADEEAIRIARLRGLSHGDTVAEPVQPEAEPEVLAPPPADTIIAPVPASPLLVKKPSGQSWDFREMLSSYAPEAESSEAEPIDLEQDWEEAEPLEPEQDWGGGPPSEPEPDWVEPEPLEPVRDRDGSEPVEPEPGDTEPLELEQDWGDLAPREPLEDPVPVLSGSGREVPVGPGFSLLDALRLERPQTIFPLPAFHTVEEDEEGPAPPVATQPDPIPPLAAEPVDDVEQIALALPEPEPELAAEPEPVSFAVAESAPPAWPTDPAWLREVEARILPKTPHDHPAILQLASTLKPESKGILARIRDWWYGRR